MRPTTDPDKWLKERYKENGEAKLSRLCDNCGQFVEHISTQSGNRETIRCTACGHEQSYVTK